MKRSDVEQKLSGAKHGLSAYVENSPIPAVVISFVLGVFFSSFAGTLLPIVLVAAAVAFLLWFFGDQDEELIQPAEKPSAGGGTTKVNGSSPSVEPAVAVDSTKKSKSKGRGKKTPDA